MIQACPTSSKNIRGVSFKKKLTTKVRRKNSSIGKAKPYNQKDKILILGVFFLNLKENSNLKVKSNGLRNIHTTGNCCRDALPWERERELRFPQSFSQRCNILGSFFINLFLCQYSNAHWHKIKLFIKKVPDFQSNMFYLGFISKKRLCFSKEWKRYFSCV